MPYWWHEHMMPPPIGIPEGGGFFPVGLATSHRGQSVKRHYDGTLRKGTAKTAGSGSKAPPGKGSAYLLSLLPPETRPEKTKFCNARSWAWRLIKEARRAGKVPNAREIASEIRSLKPSVVEWMIARLLEVRWFRDLCWLFEKQVLMSWCSVRVEGTMLPSPMVL